MHSAVLFLVFNRPATTRQVFEAIRKAKPTRLYVAADGPRLNRESDKMLCDEVRQIVTDVNWPCEVHTLFRDENIGCAYAPYKAITWFFEHEPEGIILEDDCVPHPDFFYYCDWALNAYRENHKVWHINGNNFDCPESIYESSTVSFTALAQVWGWATWKDRWSEYQNNPFYLMEQIRRKHNNWMLTSLAKLNKISHIASMESGFETWDFQWQAVVLNNGGLCVSCSSNLISNIGDGVDATHTKTDDRVHLNIKEIPRNLEYVEPKLNKRLNSWFEKKMGLRAKRGVLVWCVKVILRRIKLIYRSLIARIVFWNIKPIVIASTGRSGSSLLYDAIAESIVLERFGFSKDTKIGRALIGYAQNYAKRLEDVDSFYFPVHKTHDLLSNNLSRDVRYIFVYGDPLEAALSVEKMVEMHGRFWFDTHQFHLQASGDYENLYQKDVLNYERQIISWLGNSEQKVFGIQFEEIWDRVDEVSEYLGFKIILPDKRERKQKPSDIKYNMKLFAHLRSLMSKYS